jgi:hypothetical protein
LDGKGSAKVGCRHPLDQRKGRLSFGG